MTENQRIKVLICANSLSQKAGVYTARWGFFYRNGGTSKKHAEVVRMNVPGSMVLDHGEVWKSRSSHWWVKFTIAKNMNHVYLKCANWIVPLVDPARRRDAVEKTRRRITQLEFDAVAFTGLSGSVIAGAVVSAMDKYLYCVRKSTENRHSEYQVEGPSTGLRYVIIDDFISTGTTIKRIIELVGAHTNGTAVCVGVYLWRDDILLRGVPVNKDYWAYPDNCPSKITS